MSEALRSYSKIYQLGHRETLGMFADSVTVEEKVDGSQFSFGKDENGNLFCRSRNNSQFDSRGGGKGDKMFDKGVDSVLDMSVSDTLMDSPKHVQQSGTNKQSGRLWKMPYTRQEDRVPMDPFLRSAAKEIKTSGDLTYAITYLMHLRTLARMKEQGAHLSYTMLSQIRASAGDAYDEFYRAVMSKYEDQKRRENGAVSVLDSLSLEDVR